MFAVRKGAAQAMKAAERLAINLDAVELVMQEGVTLGFYFKSGLAWHIDFANEEIAAREFEKVTNGAVELDNTPREILEKYIKAAKG